MSTIQKILLGLGALFIVIMAGEVGYYFFLQPSKSSSPTDVLLNLPENLTPGPSQKLNQVSGTKKPVVQNSMVNYLINYFSNIQRSAVSSALLTIQYQGVIDQIDTVGVTKNGIDYAFKIRIKTKQGANAAFYFPKEALFLIKVQKLVDNKPIPLTTNDLKIGDSVRIKAVMNILKNPNRSLIEFTITKL